MESLGIGAREQLLADLERAWRPRYQRARVRRGAQGAPWAWRWPGSRRTADALLGARTISMSGRISLAAKGICGFAAAVGIIGITGSPDPLSVQSRPSRGPGLHPPLKAFLLSRCPSILPVACTTLRTHVLPFVITLFAGVKLGTLGPEDLDA